MRRLMHLAVLGIAATALPVSAIETIASPNATMSDNAMLGIKIDSTAAVAQAAYNALTAEVNKVKACNALKKFYKPADASADGIGCVAPSFGTLALSTATRDGATGSHYGDGWANAPTGSCLPGELVMSCQTICSASHHSVSSQQASSASGNTCANAACYQWSSTHDGWVYATNRANCLGVTTTP